MFRRRIANLMDSTRTKEYKSITPIQALIVLTGIINTFTAIVDLSRSNFSIACTPLFQLKSAM